MNGIKHVHLIAICGTGMAALAGMLKEKGFLVSGSDQNFYPPMSTQLERLGIKLFTGYRPENLHERPDLIVVGNAVSKNNPEVQAMVSQNIDFLSFPEALTRFFWENKIPLVVAGTHGKTTTSSLLAWVLEAAGYDPSFIIGGIPLNFDQNYRLGSGEFIIVEGDEYDTAFFDKRPKFLLYGPQAAILTSIEFDHGDIYPDLEAIKRAFQDFIKLIPEKGFLAAGIDFPNVGSILKEAHCPIATYGFNRTSDWRARIIRTRQGQTQFLCYHRGKEVGEFRWSIPGRHNIQNALGVIAMASHLGIKMERIIEALKTFQGVKRRQEVIGTINGITVIDDFAHHPTAVKETLSALKRHFNRRRLWAIFEPRTNTSRRYFFQKEYVTGFLPADRIIIARVYNQAQIPENERFRPEELVKDLRMLGKEAFFIEGADQIMEYLKVHLEFRDIVVIMSSGSFGNIHFQLMEALK